jgi:hypothetical protein
VLKDCFGTGMPVTVTGVFAFLSRINPYWNRRTMQQLWRVHLDQVKAQAVARLNGDYASRLFCMFTQGWFHGMGQDFTYVVKGILKRCRNYRDERAAVGKSNFRGGVNKQLWTTF